MRGTEAWKRQAKRWRRWRYALKKSPLSIVGIGLVAFFFVLAVIAPLVAPPQGRDPYQIPTISKLEPQPPSLKHSFGTGEYGIDIFYGVVWGARTSMRIALTIVLVTSLIGFFIGVTAGYCGGLVEEVTMRVADIFLAIPSIVLAMAVASVLGRSIENLIFAMAIIWWPRYARVMRAEVLATKEKQYIRATAALGANPLRIIFNHIVPNSIHSLLVIATVDLGHVILVSAGLSFVGLGVAPGTAEWGVLLSESRSWILMGKWWTFLFPGAALFFFVLGWSLCGDYFRDMLDPHLHV